MTWGNRMPKGEHGDFDEPESEATSIDRLLQVEQAVEARLADVKRAASRIVSDAYHDAQAIDRKTTERIDRLARQCMEENDRRVDAILAKAAEIGERPLETRDMRPAIRAAAKALARRLTGEKT